MRIPPARWVALTGTVGISFSAVLVVLADVAPLTAALYRGIYALPVLLAAGWLLRHRDNRAPRLRALAVVAGVFLGLDLWFWHYSIDMIGAGLGTVIANTQVVFVGVFGWVAYRERPTRQTLVFGFVVFLGVVLTSGLGRGDAFGDDPLLGAVLGVVSALAYAVFLLMFRHSNPSGDAPALLALLDATIGLVAVTLLIALLSTDLATMTPSWPAHGWLVLLGVSNQAVAWWCIAYAMPRLPALTVSVIILAQPVLAVMWAWLMLGETLSSIQALGALLVLGGMTAVNLQRSLVTSPEPVAVDGS